MGLTHHAGGASHGVLREGREGVVSGHPELRTIYGVRGSERDFTTTAASVHIAPFCHPHHLGRAASCDDASPLRPRSPLVNHFCPSDLAVR